MSLTHGRTLVSPMADTTDRPADILQRLTLVPGAEEALALFREPESSGKGGVPNTALIDVLKGIRQRLLAEASPDYWIQEFSIGDDYVASHHMDLAVDAAATRLGEAAAVATIIEGLEGQGSNTLDIATDTDSSKGPSITF